MKASRRRIEVSHAARIDVGLVLSWSEDRFGKEAADRYQRLIEVGVEMIRADPERGGSRALDQRPDLRRFDLSRIPVDLREVRRPQHLLLYTILADGTVRLLRVLHDAMDLTRHLADG